MRIITNPEIVGFVTIDANELPFEQHDLDPLIVYRDTVLCEDIYDPFDDGKVEQTSSQVQRWVARLREEMEALSPDLCYFRIIPKQSEISDSKKSPEFGTWTDQQVADFCHRMVRTITEGTLRSWEPRHFLDVIKKLQ